VNIASAASAPETFPLPDSHAGGYMGNEDSLKDDQRMTKRGTQVIDGNVLEWLSSQNLSGMRGKWIVAYKMKIVGKADTLKGAMKQAHLPPDSVPFVLQVPVDENLTV